MMPDACACAPPHIAGDDWYQTEDIAKIDNTTGTFTLHGRADRVVKVEGKRISLGAVERHLRQSDLVEDAIALIPDDNDRRLGVVAVLSPAGRDMLADIGRFRMGRQLRRENRQIRRRRCFAATLALCRSVTIRQSGQTPASFAARPFCQYGTCNA